MSTCSQGFGSPFGFLPWQFLAVAAAGVKAPSAFPAQAQGAIAPPASREPSYERSMRHKDGTFRRISWRLIADKKERVLFAIGRPTQG